VHRVRWLGQWAIWGLVGAVVGAAVGGCGKPSSSDSAGQGNPPPAAIGGASNASQPGQATPTHDPLYPVVLMDTTMGKITIQLDAEKAPLTVANFLQYVQEGFYNGTIFHLVAKGDVVVGGGYTPDLKEKPTNRPPVRNEAHRALKNTRGTIAMARRPDATDSATCQFFFNLADNPRLDFQDQTPENYGFCAFGRVIEGMDVLDKIGQVPVEDLSDFPCKPVQPVVIRSVQQIR
jgi:peptidyl-prolyl cis-trans isomerase A (cyclophilin A)